MATTAANSFPRLVGDVGGTNARFAWLRAPGEAQSEIDNFACADFASLAQAIRHYLQRHALPQPRWCAIGIATAVVSDHVVMTNHPWSFSISEMQRDLALDRLLVINDFTAFALSLPALQPSELQQVGNGQAVHGAPLALLGAGTGLGVSGLFGGSSGQAMIAIDGVGGHVTLPASDEREERIVALLRRRYGHASAERALSGPGLENLHQALGELAGRQLPPYAASQIADHASKRSDAHCVEAVELFFSFLGTVAGDLALTLGARGGVYIGGGIVPKLGDEIQRSRFRKQFESKGRFQSYLAHIPTYVVRSSVSPALLGAARALEVS